MWSIGGIIPTVENRSIRRKAVTLQIFTPQISHVEAQDQTRAFRFEAAATITRTIIWSLVLSYALYSCHG